MPSYSFECDCGATLSVFYRMSERPEATPCECGGEARRVFGNPAVAVPYDWGPLREKAKRIPGAYAPPDFPGFEPETKNPKAKIDRRKIYEARG